jgi:hypothetical protein
LLQKVGIDNRSGSDCRYFQLWIELELPLLGRIIQDEEHQEYRFLTVAKLDLQRRSVQDDQRLSMTLFEKDYHQQMQETFSQIDNTIISS